MGYTKTQSIVEKGRGKKGVRQKFKSRPASGEKRVKREIVKRLGGGGQLYKSKNKGGMNLEKGGEAWQKKRSYLKKPKGKKDLSKAEEEKGWGRSFCSKKEKTLDVFFLVGSQSKGRSARPRRRKERDRFEGENHKSGEVLQIQSKGAFLRRTRQENFINGERSQ